METSLYSFYLPAPEIPNPDYYEVVKDYKFSEKVVSSQGDSEGEDESPSRMTINDVAFQLDNLTRLVEKMAATSHSR